MDELRNTLTKLKQSLTNDDSNNLQTLTNYKNDILKINSSLMNNNLSNYELETYKNDINTLMKIIDQKLLEDNTFVSQLDFEIDDFEFEDSAHLETEDDKEIQLLHDQDLEIDTNMDTFKNLKNSTISSSKTTNIQQGSLLFEDIHNSVICLTSIPFEKGNILITNCFSTLIILNLQENNSIQLRFHNFENCKIFINPSVCNDTENKQNVIIENFRDCAFHTDTKDQLIIQNFSNLGSIIKDPSKNSDESIAFDYTPFPINGDLDILKQMYIYTENT